MENNLERNTKTISPKTKIKNNTIPRNATINTKKNSNKSFIITLLLSIFFGFLGLHRFYVGKVATGLIWLFTLGLFGIGYVADIIVITSQTFQDVNNKTISI